MPSHYWGDEDFDWKSLYQAENEIVAILKLGRIGVHSKEKFGTLRWSIYLFDGSFYSLTHPGYVYIHYPYWLRVIDAERPLRWLIKPIQYLQVKLLKYAFNKVCKKYPHIVKEIVCHADEWYLPSHLAVIRNSMWKRIGE